MASKTTYKVTAPLVIGKNEQGGDVYLYQGTTVPAGQSDEWLKSHLDSGMVAKESDADEQLAAAAPDTETAESAPAKK